MIYKFLKLVLVFACLTLSFPILAHNGDGADEEDRIYIDPQSVVISEKGIAIQINNDLIPVPGIFSDEEGLYVSKGYSMIFYCP